MKKAAVILIVLAVVAYGGFRVWRILFPGDEAEIRTMLTELSEAASFSVSSKPLTQMGKAAELTGFFTETIEIRAKGPEGGIRKIEGLRHRLRGQMAPRRQRQTPVGSRAQVRV